MTRIEIEQYAHTWHAEVEGGTGLSSRRKTVNVDVNVAGFPEMITAVVEAWADVNDREPLAILREVGRVMVQRENELMAKRDRIDRAYAAQFGRPPTYDDLGNEQPPPALRHYPKRPIPVVALERENELLEQAAALEHDPETWGERETQPTSGLGSPGFEPVPRRGFSSPGFEQGHDSEHDLATKPLPHRRGPGRPRKEAPES